MPERGAKIDKHSNSKYAVDLILDIGNTRGKAAIFDGDRLIRRFAFDVRDIEGFTAGLMQEPIARAALGTVAGDAGELVGSLGQRFPVTMIGSDSDVPIASAYATVSTLGVDRLANAVAASSLFPGRPVLAIDLGTCITYDYVDAQGVYQGGAITPGGRMRASAMHTYSARLPLVDDAVQAGPFATSTAACLQAGIGHGILGELRHFIGLAHERDRTAAVVLTGGDALHHGRALKSGIFAHPFLTLEGLRIIFHHGHGHGVAAAAASARPAG